MPGSVQNAVASTVLPAGLCFSFSSLRDWQCDINVYVNGESQRDCPVSTPRRVWEQSRPLTADQWDTLRTFILARRFVEAFFFYDPSEPGDGNQPGSNYDATGVNTQGRYTVVIRGPLTLERNMTVNTGTFQLVQVA